MAAPGPTALLGMQQQQQYDRGLDHQSNVPTWGFGTWSAPAWTACAAFPSDRNSAQSAFTAKNNDSPLLSQRDIHLRSPKGTVLSPRSPPPNPLLTPHGSSKPELILSISKSSRRNTLELINKGRSGAHQAGCPRTPPPQPDKGKKFVTLDMVRRAQSKAALINLPRLSETQCHSQLHGHQCYSA